MEYLVWLALFIPLLSFLILMIFSSSISRTLAGVIGSIAIFIPFVLFVSYLVLYSKEGLSPQVYKLFQWMPIPGIDADFSLRLDHLSLLMTLIITGVGFLIHVYSIGYMEHDEDVPRYFACMNFFVFSMLLLVLAGHVLVLFVGWEGVGLASYLLIGFWYTHPTAASAATKAFVINRIGDLGFLLGILLTFYLFGTGDITTISQQVGEKFALGAPILTALTLLYFIGATGKSAQIPLHTWLPDAMEGPTPVSALIHAATMVTAGVYLVVRLHPLFMMTPITLHIIGIIGAVTSLFASLCAVGQTDLKKVLAYSTVSQLGLMFLACGVGSFYAAMFHLTTHAFIKALLFLSAGNVIHMMSDITDMGKMGGLAKKFPLTHWLFLIGVLALSGVPPLSAFFSKDLILEQDFLAGYKTLFYVALAASILTAFYLTRAYCLTFTGKFNIEGKVLNRVKEAPWVMLVPVIILAFLALTGGFLGFSFGKTPILEGFLAEVGIKLSQKGPTGFNFLWSPETLISAAGAFLGVGVAAVMYTKYLDRLGPTWQILKKAFYIDEIYWALIVVPIKGLANFISNVLEPKFFDGIITGVVGTAQRTARGLQAVQSGQIRSYVAWMVVGTVLLIVYLVL